MPNEVKPATTSKVRSYLVEIDIDEEIEITAAALSTAIAARGVSTNKGFLFVPYDAITVTEAK